MTPIDHTDARLAGVILLLLVPLLVSDGVISARGAYTGVFWASERDNKIEHIADHPRSWALIGIGSILTLVAMTAGMSALW